MKITYRLILACLIACLPIAAVTAAENAVLRMPDLYRSHFKNVETAAETGLNIKDEQLADFFSDFMRGKLERFDIRESVESLSDAEENFFLAGEQNAMLRARRLLDQNLYLGSGALILLLLSFLLIWKNGYREALRWAVKVSFLLWAGIWGIIAFAVLRPGGREAVLRYIYGYTIGRGSLLYQILSTEFYRTFIIAIAAGSLALMVIAVWLVYKLTKPKKMFGQSETVRRR